MSKNKKPAKNQYSHSVPRKIILLGKLFQFFSTDLAARFAARVFATPVRFKVPEREMMMRNSAKKERLKVKGIGRDIQVYVYGYSKKKVLMVHGWAGRGTQMFQIADKLLENRMMVVSFDGPAHGLSTGKRTNMLEFLETIREIDRQYGPFDVAIGHSFGAMTLINAVANDLKIDQLVTIGADNSVSQVFQLFTRKMELKPVVAERLLEMYEKKFGRSVEDLSSEHKARSIKIPTLVIHDSEDKIVDVSSALSIRLNLQNGELLMTNGLGHHKIFRDHLVIRRIIEFIT